MDQSNQLQYLEVMLLKNQPTNLGLDHQLNDNQLLYATYSTGFKPGGFNHD
jgi:outer membrane receptor protein involved in Fe transport